MADHAIPVRSGDRKLRGVGRPQVMRASGARRGHHPFMVSSYARAGIAPALPGPSRLHTRPRVSRASIAAWAAEYDRAERRGGRGAALKVTMNGALHALAVAMVAVLAAYIAPASVDAAAPKIVVAEWHAEVAFPESAGTVTFRRMSDGSGRWVLALTGLQPGRAQVWSVTLGTCATPKATIVSGTIAPKADALRVTLTISSGAMTRVPRVGAQLAVTSTPGGCTDLSRKKMDDFMAACPTAGEIAFVNAAVHIVFKQDVTKSKGLVCRAKEGSADLTLLQERVYQGILAFRRLEFTRRLPWTRKSLFDWFAQAAPNIIIDSGARFSSGAGHLITLALGERASVLVVPRWSSDAFDGGGLSVTLEVFVHEARHAEGDHGHTCGSIDRTVKELGAFGVQYYYYVWLARYADDSFLQSPPDHPAHNAAFGAQWILRWGICQQDAMPSPTPTLVPSQAPGPTPGPSSAVVTLQRG